jgi:hypothetical protein
VNSETKLEVINKFTMIYGVKVWVPEVRRVRINKIYSKEIKKVHRLAARKLTK